MSWLDNCDDIQSTDSMIDVGCGNGMMLIEMVGIIFLTKKETCTIRFSRLALWHFLFYP